MSTFPFDSIEPSPFHNLTSIFVGWLEPITINAQFAVTVDEWDDTAVGQYHYDDFVALKGELQKLDKAYYSGLFLQCSQQAIHKSVLVIHHVMPLESAVNRRDTAPLCIRKAQLEHALASLPGAELVLPTMVPFMTKHGVIDERKLRDLALDMRCPGFVMKSNYAYWQDPAPANRIDGFNGPAWIRWAPTTKSVDDDEDF